MSKRSRFGRVINQTDFFIPGTADDLTADDFSDNISITFSGSSDTETESLKQFIVDVENSCWPEVASDSESEFSSDSESGDSAEPVILPEVPVSALPVDVVPVPVVPVDVVPVVRQRKRPLRKYF